MKKFLLALLSTMVLSNGAVLASDIESQIAEKESEIEELRKQLEGSEIDESADTSIIDDSIGEIIDQVAIGATNSTEQIEQLLRLFGLEETVANSVISIDGILLNEYLNDGSNENTNIYSSVLVNTSSSSSGLNVEILTPENITEVSASAYQNAAITAGATNADIKIASVQPVTGEGALGEVYEIFKQAGYNLEASDIQAGENLIEIEQILKEETNMTDNDISQLVTEYNLAIVNAVEDKEELSEQEVLEILNEVLSEYNFQFSENVRSKLLSHGITFSQSDVSKDPNTRQALEETMNRYKALKEGFTHGDIEVEIKEIYFTDERNEYQEKNYDNVLTILYTLTNNGESETSAGSNDFELYVDGVKADHYFLMSDQSSMVSSNRSVEVKTSFGFNGVPENMELELSDMKAWDSDPLIIKLNNDGTPMVGR